MLVLVGCGDASRPAEEPWPITSVASDVATSDAPDPEDDEDAHESSSSEAGSSEAESTSGVDGDYPHIARVEVPAAWLGRDDGLWDPPWSADASPFHAIGHAFYEDHPDAWDFLVVYTESEITGPFALADTVAYDLQGIGIPPSDWVRPQDAGSAGRLQQINVMNTPQFYADDPSAADVLVHETAHRWSAFIELPGTPQEGWLLDESFAHWNVHVSTGGPSATGYGELVDLGGGSFRFNTVWPLQLSPLELYLAGLIPPEEVGPLFWVASPVAYEPAVSPLTGLTFDQHAYGEDVAFAGTRVDFGIDDVIARNGPRSPEHGEAPTHFRFAFVLVCFDAAACPDADLRIVDAQRLGFVDDFASATGHRATADVSLQP